MRLLGSRQQKRWIRFNPRICKRCDTVKALSESEYEVSIHASVKDATQQYIPPEPLSIVSIHASVKDATITPEALIYPFIRFNPRICKRCDMTVFGYQRPWYVSIHASVKDATVLPLLSGLPLTFQSTHL